MKAPYLLHFEVPFKIVAGASAQGPAYRLTTASATDQYVFDTATLVVQRLNLHPFYVELFELNTRDPFSLGLELAVPRHFLFFMRHGQARFTTPEGFYLSQAPEAHLCACYKASGYYRVSLRRGRHVACCVNLDPDWLDYATEKLPVFRYAAGSPLSCTFLPYVPIDPYIRQRLEEVLMFKRNGHGRLDGFLRLKFAEILEYYAPRAEDRQQGLASRIYGHLQEHFTDPGISYQHLSARFKEGERRLRYHFYKEYGISIHQFLTHKRLQLAHRLIMQEGLPIRDVYLPAGYHDESTFRYAYRNFFLSIGKSDF